MSFLFIRFSDPCYTSLTLWIPMVYASTNEHLCISAASVAVFCRAFWKGKSTYLSFILRYRVRAFFPAVTASFNAHIFDWRCCHIWNSKMTFVRSQTNVQKWEAATRGVLWKKLFLEFSQNSRENTCARISILIKLPALGL